MVITMKRNILISGISKINYTMSLLILLVLLCIFFSFVNPDVFLSTRNFTSMAFQFPEFGLLALGIALTMISGGIDISVVATANLSAIFAAMIMRTAGNNAFTEPQTIIIAIIAALLTGVICGLINGSLVARLGITPFMATLVGSQMFFGLSVAITGGSSVVGLPATFSRVGNTLFFNTIPLKLVVFMVFLLLLAFILKKTLFGARLYMIGSNYKAAQYSGINNVKLLTITYVMSGLLSSVAGLVMLTNYNAANPSFGSAYKLQCVLIAILGGMGPAGYSRKFSGVLIAILILQVVSSGLSLFPNASMYFRSLLWGALLIAMMIITRRIRN